MGILLVISFVQMIQIGSLKGTGISASVSTGAVTLSPASGGESYDQMMARMHPDQVKQPSPSAPAANSPKMVGGC